MMTSLLSIFYPSYCLHCRSQDLLFRRSLCEECLTHLQLLDKKECCALCFKPFGESKYTLCRECYRNKNSPRLIGALEGYGPALSLLQEMRRRPRKDLAKVIASYIILQYFNVEKEVPDYLIPIPEPWILNLGKKESVNQMIAKEMGCLIKKPLLSPLKGFFNFSDQTAEIQFKLKSRFLKKGHMIVNKNILLIADNIRTKDPFVQCRDLLTRFFPDRCIGIGLIHSIGEG